jgi:dienelactone hydrolase
MPAAGWFPEGSGGRKDASPEAQSMSQNLFPDQEPVLIEPPGLDALLGVPALAKGLVIFAHGSGSGRLSPRNNQVAAALRGSGVATLLLDLLTPAEEQDRRNVFDIPLLASRLLDATDWATRQPRLAALPIGYFGASTGAGAALRAAADPWFDVAAVVSRGGRPDMALDALDEVRAPTLLLVGGNDGPVIDLNRRAQARLARAELVVIPGAGHLFEEPGTLDEVVRLATDWFLRAFAEPRPEDRSDAVARPPLF